MILKTIEEEWKFYASCVYNTMTPSPVQEWETKKGFFAGFGSLLLTMQKIGDGRIPEDYAMAYLNARVKEMKDFAVEASRGDP